VIDQSGNALVNEKSNMIVKMVKRKIANVSTVYRVTLCALFLGACTPVYGSDHADTNLLSQLGRHDARIGDFYVFTRGDRLVMVMTIFGAPSDEDYSDFHFHDDVLYRFLIDRDSVVRFDNRENNRKYGGTIVEPQNIREDIVIALRFKEDGASYLLETTGLTPQLGNSISVFAGVRDEPFIRGTRIGKDIAALVVELPLNQIVGGAAHEIILAWSTTDLLDQGDEQDELGGRAYRSQLAEFEKLNFLHPSKHTANLNVPPDVLIFNTSRPAKFPNGRDLVDDVVDLLGIQGAPNNPSENDVEFLPGFPYLPPPKALRE
jgi:hypothetical protein